jgi:basic amino acid/polyamine antiporter, APA family
VPVLPIASIGACLWLMLNLTALTWVRFGVWLAVGAVIYGGYGYRHSVQGRREAGLQEVWAPVEADPNSPVR